MPIDFLESRIDLMILLKNLPQLSIGQPKFNSNIVDGAEYFILFELNKKKSLTHFKYIRNQNSSKLSFDYNDILFGFTFYFVSSCPLQFFFSNTSLLVGYLFVFSFISHSSRNLYVLFFHRYTKNRNKTILMLKNTYKNCVRFFNTMWCFICLFFLCLV